jgi:hypothetical protein
MIKAILAFLLLVTVPIAAQDAGHSWPGPGLDGRRSAGCDGESAQPAVWPATSKSAPIPSATAAASWRGMVRAERDAHHARRNRSSHGRAAAGDCCLNERHIRGRRARDRPPAAARRDDAALRQDGDGLSLGACPSGDGIDLLVAAPSPTEAVVIVVSHASSRGSDLWQYQSIHSRSFVRHARSEDAEVRRDPRW